MIYEFIFFLRKTTVAVHVFVHMYPKTDRTDTDKITTKVRMTTQSDKIFVTINVGLSPQNNKPMRTNSYRFKN